MELSNKAVYIETYGCSANQNNSEILAGLLTQAGYLITNNEKIAEIIIINTCVVKSKTESKIKRRIQDLKSSSNKLVIIAGCMPETDAKMTKKINDKAILLGTHHFKEIANLIKDYSDKKLDEKKQKGYLLQNNEIKLNLPKIPKNKLITLHQISEGCLGNCSYCKIRLAKGKLFSYPKEEILKSIESDLKNGAKEIWLTSQDNASYGLDRGKQELIELLKSILALKHKFKLRIGMMNPNNIFPILDSLIEIYKSPKMFRFIHIPIQSASNKILKDMNRVYTIEQAESIITKLRREIPNITIATDIIVAYPTENSEDYKKNVLFLKKFRPDILNLSKFSRHKGTFAENLKELPVKTIKKRAKELMLAHRETAKQNKEKFIGKTFDVFVNKKINSDLYEARDENYNIVFVKCPKEFLGKEAEIKIKNTGIHHMIGEITEQDLRSRSKII